jgi:type I restriction enzyme M protein
LNSYATAQQREVITAVENWWDKYRVSLQHIAEDQRTTMKQLRGFVEELGYGG